MIEKYKEWYDGRHDYAREWKKKTGGKVLGYFCTYVPEEILYAANILPVRILGSHEPQNITDPHILSIYCPFCRDCLAQGLKNRYEYLDGIMIAQSCLHIRQTFASWNIHLPTEFSYYLPMPHNLQSDRALPFLRAEYERLIEKLEKWTGNKISDMDLMRGIEIMDRSRNLMKSIYESRKSPDVPMTGLEAMYMVVSNQVTDKSMHSGASEAVLAELTRRSRKKDKATRLMLIGSEDDDVEFMKMAEDLDAIIVTDDHCTGTRYFWDTIERRSDPLSDIAMRYIERLPCPAKDWPKRRREGRILRFAKEWKADGVLIIGQKGCAPHELDTPSLRKVFDKYGIKALVLEADMTTPAGQLKTRVEAFLELFSHSDLF